MNKAFIIIVIFGQVTQLFKLSNDFKMRFKSFNAILDNLPLASIVF